MILSYSNDSKEFPPQSEFFLGGEICPDMLFWKCVCTEDGHYHTVGVCPGATAPNWRRNVLSGFSIQQQCPAPLNAMGHKRLDSRWVKASLWSLPADVAPGYHLHSQCTSGTFSRTTHRDLCGVPQGSVLSSLLSSSSSGLMTWTC